MGLRGLITKDVKAENENSRTIIALRILYIVVFIAFILDICFAGIEVVRMYPYRIFALFVANILLFIFTYYSKTKPSLYLFMVFLFTYTFLMIPCFGWSAGMQNYFIIVLMLTFFATHVRSTIKFLFALGVLVLRIVLISVYGGIKPQTDISGLLDKCLQSTNISAVFIAIIFISYMFSKQENEEENKLMKYNDQLKKEAGTDQLTGLFNRRRTIEYLKLLGEDKEMGAVSVAMGDIDFFKKVNDTYGHDAGDEVLKFVAATMKDCVRENSFISRWGGEEFLIILPNCNGDNAFVALERVRRTIQKSVVKVGDKEIKVTMTFGLTEFGFHQDIDKVIKEADEKLYYGKSNGRNQVVY